MDHCEVRFRFFDDDVVLRAPGKPMLYGAMYNFKGEPSILEFRDEFPDVSTVIDVGACFGAISMFFHYIWPEATIWALEPATINYRYLLQNTHPFYPLIRPIQVAASDRVATRELSYPSQRIKRQENVYDPGTNTGLLTLHGDTDTERELVQTVLLDDLFKTADYIKIDAEGEDLAVVRGAERLLREERPILQLEFNKENMEMGGWTVEDYTAVLTELDYFPYNNYASDMIWLPIEDVPDEIKTGQANLYNTGNLFKVVHE